jgi:hypothetical protein
MAAGAAAELRAFMQRAAALRLYRHALCVGRDAGPVVRAAIEAEARAHLRAAAAIARDDPSQEQRLLAVGAEFVETVRKMALLTR